MSYPLIIYTHRHKGGRYQCLGQAKSAGTVREDGGKPMTIYRCLDTGQLYYRSEPDFDKNIIPSS